MQDTSRLSLHSKTSLLFFTFNRESRIRALFNKFSMEKESSTRVKIYFDYCRCCESFSVHFHSSWEHFSLDKFLQIRTTICVQTSAAWRQRRNDAKKCMDSFKVEADLSFHFLISPVTESYKCRVGRSHYARGWRVRRLKKKRKDQGRNVVCVLCWLLLLVKPQKWEYFLCCVEKYCLISRRKNTHSV